MDKNELLKQLEKDNIQNLWIVYHDFNGRACAKTVPPPQFENAINHGIVFARANLNFAFHDDHPPDWIFQADSGDFLATPDPDSYYRLPYLENTAMVLVDMMTENDMPFEGDPRLALKKVIDAYADQGITLTAALESEFALYRKIGDGEYEVANADGMFTVAGLNRHADLMHEIVGTLETMGIPVEQMGKEYGPSQYEMTTRYNTPVIAADQYLIMKEVVRALALKRDLVASYMPKTYEEIPGSGLHVHLALWDKESGENLMLSPDPDQQVLSDLGLSFVGGLLHHGPGLSGVGSPTVNSYKRLQPGSWAPAHITWGVGTRSALVRIPDTNRRVRAEYRAGDNTCNPYMYLTALLAAGLDGINNKISPGEPISDVDVGHFDEADMEAYGVRYLPRSLPEALKAFEDDPVLAEALAPVIGQEFLKIKRLEHNLYNLHVHNWERKMYLEVT